MTDPDVRTYDDFRHYLRDWFKARSGRPSQNGFARRVHCSPSLLSSVLNGRRVLDADRAERWADALGLDGDDRAHFLDLVLAEDGPTQAVREQARARLRASRTFSDMRTLAADGYRFYADWVHTAVLEVTRLPDFERDPAWIADRIHPPITPDEAAASLAFLDQAGFLGEGGDERLGTAMRDIHTGHEVHGSKRGVPVAHYQQQLLEVARHRLTRVDSQHRSYQTLTFTTDAEGLELVKGAARRFQEELVRIAMREDVEPDRVLLCMSVATPVAGEGPAVVRVPTVRDAPLRYHEPDGPPHGRDDG